MMRAILVFGFVTIASSQGLDPAALLRPDAKTWPTYYGDYSGHRYSQVSQINRSNVGSITLAWTFAARTATAPTLEPVVDRSATTLTSVPLEFGGVLYFSLPDNVWAIDATTGKQIWHFYRPAPGTHMVNRGLGMYRNSLFFGTPDAHVIALDARTGKKEWDDPVGSDAGFGLNFGQAFTMAPLVVGSRVIVGSSGDGADVPGFAAALDAETGKLLWKWDAVPKPGQLGAETWPSGKTGEDIMGHGGGSPSMTPTFDPELNLLYLATGSPRPAMAGDVRPGANLYSCSIVALNIETGKMAWHFQVSPHETHNWDANQTPVLFDADFKGGSRKLIAQASRNGYFYLLDRATGESLLTVPFVANNWSSGVNSKGQPVPKTGSAPRADGVLVAPGESGATGWAPPSYSPDTKLLYVSASTGSYAMFYTIPSAKLAVPRGVAGFARDVARGTSQLVAIDYATGKPRWVAEAAGLGGLLSTAGGLVFASGPGGNVLALDAATGKILWHAGVGVMANSAITYELDDRQYVVTPVADTLYAWALPPP